MSNHVVPQGDGVPRTAKRLSKRVVPKADGRYLIYYEKRDKA